MPLPLPREISVVMVTVSVQLVDPWGYRMMAYAAPLDGKGLLADLRRLLRASNEDIERLQRSGELAHE